MTYTLHQLEVFNKVALLGSVTKASEALYLTQPAVSIQLKKFQEQFDIPLFEVVSRKLYITEFGKEIALAAQNILNEVAAINYRALSYKGELAGKLKIAIVSTAKYVMPYFLTSFIKENPGVELIMDVTNKSEVVKALEANTVDFALISTLPSHLKIETIKLMSNKLFLVAGKQLASPKGNLAKKQMEKLPLIYREQGSATRLAMEEFIASHKISTYKKIELTSNEAVKQAVIAGLGVSIMPLIGIKNELKNNDLQIIKVKDLPITTHWNLTWLSSKNMSLISTAYIDHINKSKETIIKNHFEWFNNY